MTLPSFRALLLATALLIGMSAVEWAIGPEPVVGNVNTGRR